MSEPAPQRSTEDPTAATRELFDAISAYSSHPDYRNAERDAAALARMRAALAAGADWSVPLDSGRRDAAFVAAATADRGPLEVLLDHGVPLDHRAGYDGMLIHRAASFGITDVIAMLVERGIAPDVRDEVTGQSPLDCARGGRYGQPAIPVLIEMMRANGFVPGPPRRGDDLRLERVLEVLPELDAELSVGDRAAFRRLVEGFFAERRGGRYRDFLEEVAEQNDGEILAAGITVVNRVSTAQPKSRATRARRDDVIHHGDLEITEDHEAMTLVVTGNLTVRGQLTNYYGRIVGVGGDLRAQAVWSQGPLWVGGDLTAEVGFGCSGNDYRAVVRGTLETPTLVHLYQHSTEFGAVRAGRRFEDREDLPAEPLEAADLWIRLDPHR